MPKNVCLTRINPNDVAVLCCLLLTFSNAYYTTLIFFFLVFQGAAINARLLYSNAAATRDLEEENVDVQLKKTSPKKGRTYATAKVHTTTRQHPKGVGYTSRKFEQAVLSCDNYAPYIHRERRQCKMINFD